MPPTIAPMFVEAAAVAGAAAGEGVTAKLLTTPTLATPKAAEFTATRLLYVVPAGSRFCATAASTNAVKAGARATPNAATPAEVDVDAAKNATAVFSEVTAESSAWEVTGGGVMMMTHVTKVELCNARATRSRDVRPTVIQLESTRSRAEMLDATPASTAGNPATPPVTAGTVAVTVRAMADMGVKNAVSEGVTGDINAELLTDVVAAAEIIADDETDKEGERDAVIAMEELADVLVVEDGETDDDTDEKTEPLAPTEAVVET